MEINISRFFAEAEPFEFSRSRAEYGDNAGPTSWANAVKAGTDSPLLTTPEQLQALRDYVRGFVWSLKKSPPGRRTNATRCSYSLSAAICARAISIPIRTNRTGKNTSAARKTGNALATSTAATTARFFTISGYEG